MKRKGSKSDEAVSKHKQKGPKGNQNGAKGSLHGAKERPKSNPKSAWAPGSILGAKKGSKMRTQRLLFAPFLVHFWSNLALKNDEKTLVFTLFSRFWPSKNPSKNRCENRVRKKRDTAKKQPFSDTAP